MEFLDAQSDWSDGDWELTGVNEIIQSITQEFERRRFIGKIDPIALVEVDETGAHWSIEEISE